MAILIAAMVTCTRPSPDPANQHSSMKRKENGELPTAK